MDDIKAGSVVKAVTVTGTDGKLEQGKEYVVHSVSSVYVTLKESTAVWRRNRFVLADPPKPPLGLRPRHIAEAPRIQEIMEAATRYTEAGKQVPQDWLDELTELKAREVK